MIRLSERMRSIMHEVPMGRLVLPHSPEKTMVEVCCGRCGAAITKPLEQEICLTCAAPKPFLFQPEYYPQAEQVLLGGLRNGVTDLGDLGAARDAHRQSNR